MEATVDTYRVPFRRPRGWVPAALAAAAGAVAVTVVGAVLRVATIPAAPAFEPLPMPPKECPGEAGCAFSPLANAPSLGAVYVARKERTGDPPTPLAELPAGWEPVRDPADRELLAVMLAEVALHVTPRTPLPDEDLTRIQLPIAAATAQLLGPEYLARLGPEAVVQAHAARYQELRSAAWTETLELRRRYVREENPRRAAAARLAEQERDLASTAALWPRLWDWVLLACGAIAVLAAVAHRQLAYAPVWIDGHAVHSGPRRFLWEELGEVSWELDHVELVGRDGVATRIDGVALAERERAALQALSDRLLRRRTEGAAPTDAADDLAALIGRVGR